MSKFQLHLEKAGSYRTRYRARLDKHPSDKADAERGALQRTRSRTFLHSSPCSGVFCLSAQNVKVASTKAMMERMLPAAQLRDQKVVYAFKILRLERNRSRSACRLSLSAMKSLFLCRELDSVLSSAPGCTCAVSDSGSHQLEAVQISSHRGLKEESDASGLSGTSGQQHFPPKTVP